MSSPILFARRATCALVRVFDCDRRNLDSRRKHQRVLCAGRRLVEVVFASGASRSRKKEYPMGEARLEVPGDETPYG